MSIHRISAAYEYCKRFSRAELNGSQMAVLIALAYSENDITHKCFPGVERLVELTHLDDNTISRARNRLRELELIGWERGHKGRSNNYWFNFGVAKNSKSNDDCRYAVNKPESSQSASFLHAPPRDNHTLTTGQPHPHHGITPTPPRGTNTETTQKNNTEYNTEDVRSDDLICSVSKGSSELFNVFCASPEKRSVDQSAKPQSQSTIKPETVEAVKYIMERLGVTDNRNREIFTSTCKDRDLQSIIEVTDRFVSECSQGEHEDVRNKAALLNLKLASEIPKNR